MNPQLKTAMEVFEQAIADAAVAMGIKLAADGDSAPAPEKPAAPAAAPPVPPPVAAPTPAPAAAGAKPAPAAGAPIPPPPVTAVGAAPVAAAPIPARPVSPLGSRPFTAAPTAQPAVAPKKEDAAPAPEDNWKSNGETFHGHPDRKLFEPGQEKNMQAWRAKNKIPSQDAPPAPVETAEKPKLDAYGTPARGITIEGLKNGNPGTSTSKGPDGVWRTTANPAPAKP